MSIQSYKTEVILLLRGIRSSEDGGGEGKSVAQGPERYTALDQAP